MQRLLLVSVVVAVVGDHELSAQLVLDEADLLNGGGYVADDLRGRLSVGERGRRNQRADELLERVELARQPIDVVMQQAQLVHCLRLDAAQLLLLLEQLALHAQYGLDVRRVLVAVAVAVVATCFWRIFARWRCNRCGVC